MKTNQIKILKIEFKFEYKEVTKKDTIVLYLIENEMSNTVYFY